MLQSLYKKLGNLLIFTFIYLFSVINTFASEAEIVPNHKSIFQFSGGGGTDMLDKIINAIIKNIFAVLALIVIGIFIYVGFLFITSSGDEAEFKKAWKIFMYTLIGLVVIVLSYGVVKLVTTIGI